MPRLRVNPLPEADSLQCRLCGKTFDQKKRLERHFNSHNDNRVRNYKCVLCDARFFETCHLDNHLRTHTGERPFKCEDCGKAYTQLSAKNRHRRTAHKHPEDQKPLESSERKTLDELNPLGEKEKTLAERKTIVIGSTTITPTGAGCASTGVSSVGTMTSLCSCPVGTNKNQHHKGEQHDSEVECALMGLSVAPSESSTLEDGTTVTLVTIPASAVDNLLSTGERVVTLALTGNGGSSGQQYRLVAASGSSTHRQALPSSITITGPSTSSTQQFEVDESTAKLLLGEYDESDEHDVKPIIVLASSPESGQVTFVSSSGDELFKNSTIIATGPVVTSAIPATKPTTVTSGTNFRPLLPRPSVSSSNQARTIQTVQPVKREYVQNDHHYSKNAGMVKTEDDVHLCNVCGKQYLGERRLARHKLSHDTNRVRPYQCQRCEQGFFANCHLVNHMRTHTGEKPFKCTKCGKDFTQASALRRHELNIHNESNPSKKIRQPPSSSTTAVTSPPAAPLSATENEGTPVVHMPKKKERPFGCYECGKFFTQLSTLYRHLRTVHGLEKYGKAKTRTPKKKRSQKKEEDPAQDGTGNSPIATNPTDPQEETSSVGTNGVCEPNQPPLSTTPSSLTPPPPLHDQRLLHDHEDRKPFEKHIVELHGHSHQVVHQYHPSTQVVIHHTLPPPAPQPPPPPAHPAIHVHCSPVEPSHHHHQLLPISNPPQPEKVIVTSSTATEYEQYLFNQPPYYWPYNAVVTTAVDCSSNPAPPPSSYFEVSSSTSSPSPTMYSQQSTIGEIHEEQVDVAG